MAGIEFRNIRRERSKEIFRKVAEHYPQLKPHHILLEQRRMNKVTMRAQPDMWSLFQKVGRTYKVQMCVTTDLDDRVDIDALPDDVLYGWFAHELGHVVDYLDYSFFGMVGFAVRYLFSKKFRKETEHKADEIAIDHGMADEILATKKFILEHTRLPEKYKRRIRTYYMSSKSVKEILKKKEVEMAMEEDANLLDPNP